jgi:hypothetical protein
MKMITFMNENDYFCGDDMYVVRQPDGKTESRMEKP